HAGHLLLSQPKTEHPMLQAESLRFFVRELRTALEWETELAIYQSPRWYLVDDSGSGPPGPNQDNEYWKARIFPGATYRIEIDTNTIDDIIIQVNNKEYRNDGDYSFKDFTIGNDGKLTIFVGPEPMPETGGVNWIRSLPDVYRVAMRVYYHDWEKHHRPDVWIERLDEPDHKSDPPPIPVMSGALDAVVDWMESWPYIYPIFQTLYADQAPPNEVRPPLGIPGGGQEIQYGLARVELADDEALLVESDVPDAPYWGFHVYTMPWFSQIDPANRVTALNDRQSHVSSDGKVRYVVSKADPGIQNWLDTGGFPTLSVFYRWIWSNDSPAPVSRVVKLADLRRELPADTPVFTPEDRRDQIAARRRHLQNRFRA
ncbi:MAG: DUF1214 domain-containing protein, partial [Novosphingobium sp.]|nr:DUF1214 domain-containing protein [Novosphingobium sp.]